MTPDEEAKAYLDKSYNLGIQHAIDLIDSTLDNPAIPALTTLQVLTVLRNALTSMLNSPTDLP